MVTGKVKFFNTTKNFGFIVRDDREPDVFVHGNNVPNGVRLLEGTNVQFDVEKTERGFRAVNLSLAP